MKTRPSHILFGFTCFGGIVGGLWFGMHGAIPKQGNASSAPPHSSREVQAGAPAQAGDADDVPNGPMLMRRMLAKQSTATLWDWLRKEPSMNYLYRAAIVAELVDRLGWRAWDVAMEPDQDPDVRRNLSESILSRLASKDPWKAYEVWKAHRAEFDRQWGADVVIEGQCAASRTSAASLIDIFQESAEEESHWGCSLEFSSDFKFGEVLDYLAATDRPPEAMPYTILTSWGDREPVDAARWLVAHPEFSKREGDERSQSEMLLRQIAYLPVDAPGRDDALAALRQMPAEFITGAWDTIGMQQNGTFSPAALSAANGMDQTDNYLVSALWHTQRSDSLDPSWQQLPEGERAGLLEKVEAAMEKSRPSESLTPVELRKRQRWQQMVSTAWGLSTQP